jgi:gas vesicle protein
MATKAKIALGVLGAAAAGVVIGLLLAPEKGSDIRKRLRKTAGSISDSLAALLAHGKGELYEARNKVRHTKSSAEEKVNRIKENMNS